MDHHCVYVANCVGRANRRFFIQFIVYASIACILQVTQYAKCYFRLPEGEFVQHLA